MSSVLAAIDVLVVAPLELSAGVITDPTKTVKKLRQELNNARFIGRLTLNRGVSEVRRRLDDGGVTPAEKRRPVRSDAATVERVESLDDDVEPTPDVDTLALPDYDLLPAIDIVAKLGELSADELRAIEVYETANRQRRTVIGKIAQLNDFD